MPAARLRIPREKPLLRPEGGKRRLQPLDQAGRAIVVAHTIKDIGIKDIGHSGVPLRLRGVVAEIRRLPASDYPG